MSEFPYSTDSFLVFHRASRHRIRIVLRTLPVRLNEPASLIRLSAVARRNGRRACSNREVGGPISFERLAWCMSCGNEYEAVDWDWIR